MGSRPNSLLRGLRVLIAEDELLISQFVREILVALGCTVIGPARDLHEALRAVRTTEIDGALLDVQLGEASVYPVAKELDLRHIPFILTTGQRNFGVGSAGLLGKAPLLHKPFRVQQLEGMIRSTFLGEAREAHRP